MKIKLDRADIVFSLYIRLRDGACVFCKRKGSPNKDGQNVVGLQNSHFFGRRKESTRFDPENCDTACFSCHMYYGGDDINAYRNFKLEQLGQKKYDALVLRANTPRKRNRKESLEVAKQLLNSIK